MMRRSVAIGMAIFLFAATFVVLSTVIVSAGCNFPNGYSGITASCITGAFAVSSTNLRSSYDMATLDAGKLFNFEGTTSRECTLNGAPTTTTGLYDGAYHFVSTSSQYALCPSGSPTTSSWTVFAIVKPISGGSKVLLSLDGSGAGNFYMTYGMNCNLGADAGKLHICTGANTNDVGATVSSGSYHYVIWTKDSPGNTATLYVDGVSQGTSVTSNAAQGDLGICRWVPGTPDYCDADFDEIATWERVLTAGEISSLSTAGSGSFFPVVATDPAVVLTDIFSNGAVLNGHVVSNGTGQVNVWFSWGDTIALGTNTTTQTIDLGAFSANLQNLAPNHVYYYLAHAENTTNASLFSNGVVVSFTTGNGQSVVGLFQLAAFVVIAISFSMVIFNRMRKRPGGRGGMG